MEWLDAASASDSVLKKKKDNSHLTPDTTIKYSFCREKCRYSYGILKMSDGDLVAPGPLGPMPPAAGSVMGWRPAGGPGRALPVYHIVVVV